MYNSEYLCQKAPSLFGFGSHNAYDNLAWTDTDIAHNNTHITIKLLYK